MKLKIFIGAIAVMMLVQACHSPDQKWDSKSSADTLNNMKDSVADSSRAVTQDLVMKVSKSDTLAGHPLIKIRDLLRPYRHGAISAKDVETDLGVSVTEAEAVLKAMIGAGFKGLETEWWHFTLKDEPYPETFFDFPMEKASLR